MQINCIRKSCQAKPKPPQGPPPAEKEVNTKEPKEKEVKEKAKEKAPKATVETKEVTQPITPPAAFDGQRGGGGPQPKTPDHPPPGRPVEPKVEGLHEVEFLGRINSLFGCLGGKLIITTS